MTLTLSNPLLKFVINEVEIKFFFLSTQLIGICGESFDVFSSYFSSFLRFINNAFLFLFFFVSYVDKL
jgi:hypothetical protein